MGLDYMSQSQFNNNQLIYSGSSSGGTWTTVYPTPTCDNSKFPFKVGDVVESSETGNHWKVIDESKCIKCVKVGHSSNGWRIGMVTYPHTQTTNYKLVKNKTMIRKLTNFIKKSTDANTQELLKASLLNGDLEPTSMGMEELNQILWFANLDALVARAKEINAEAEAKENK